jgi:tetratricopeptide (TPR) repeat protein
VDEGAVNLKIGEVPLSKFHSTAAREFEMGNRFAEKKKWGEAHSSYINCMNEMHKDQRTRVIALDENWFSVCYGVIAVCLSERKLFKEAVSHLNEAIRLDSAVKENYILRGNLYRRLHKEKEAESDFRMASGKSVLNCYPAWAQKSAWCQLPR